MSSYQAMVMPALREAARARGLLPRARKEELVAQLLRDDFKDFGVDKVKVLLRARGLAVGGRKEELVERLAAAAAAGLLPGTEPKALVAEPTSSKQPSKPKPFKPNKTKEFLSDETAAATKIKKKPAAAKKAKTSDESVAMFEEAEKSSFPGAPAATNEKKPKKIKAKEPVKTSQESSAMEKKTVKRVIRTTVTEVEEVEVSGSKKSKVVTSAGPSTKEKGKAKGKVAAVPKQEKVPKDIAKKLKGPKENPTDHNLNHVPALVVSSRALVPSSRALARISDVSEPEEMSNSGAALVAETSSDDDYTMPAFHRRRSPSPDFY